MHERVLLGSGSARRRDILGTLGFHVSVFTPEVDETVRSGEAPLDYLARIADAKLADVYARVSALGGSVYSAPIVVADTIVEHGRAILGKPASDEEATRVLARLSGEDHVVRTRFCVSSLAARAAGRSAHSETVTTRVRFRALDEGEIGAYVQSGEGRDKAGGYAIQGFASAFVASIEGSYTNVVGLPACEVYVALRALAAAHP